MSHFLTQLLALLGAELVASGILFCIYRVSSRFLRRSSDRYLFLRCAFFSFPFLPLLRFDRIWNLKEPPAFLSELSTPQAAQQLFFSVAEASGLFPFVLPTFGVFYGIGVSLALARLALAFFRLRRVVRDSQLAFRCGAAEVRVSASDMPIMTYGLVRPVILVPESTMRSLSPLDLELVLEHEMEHVRGRDYLFNFSRCVVQAVLFHSPFVHALARAFVQEMELSCDESVLRRGASAKDYGSLLLRIAQMPGEGDPLASGAAFMAKSFLAERIGMMSKQSAPSRRAASWFALIFSFALTGTALGQIDLAASTTRLELRGLRGGAEFSFGARLVFGDGRHESAVGTAELEDGSVGELGLARHRVRVVTHRMATGWSFEGELSELGSGRVVDAPRIVTNGIDGAELSSSQSGSVSPVDVAQFILRVTPR